MTPVIIQINDLDKYTRYVGWKNNSESSRP